MAKSEADQINIKIGADLSGGVQTERELEKIRAKAKSLGEETAKSSAKAERSIGTFQKSIGRLRGALTGFGVAGLFTALIAGVQKITESFGAAERQAREMQKAADAKELAKSIEDLATKYDDLATKMAACNKAQNDSLELIDMEVKARRELERAHTDSAEAAELAAVDPNALDAKEQREAISAKYNALRAQRSASNKTEDLVLARQKLNTAADQNDQTAALKTSEAEELTRKAGELKSRAVGEEQASVLPNSQDKMGGVLNYIGGNLHDIFSGNWGNLTSYKTDAGNEEREKHRAEAEKLRKEAEELDKRAKKAREEAEAAKKEAEQNRSRATAMNGLVEAADIDARTTEITNNTSESTANGALAKKRKEIERDKDYVSRVGPDRLAALQEQVAVEEGKKSDAEAKAAKEREDVWRAQQALDAFNLDNRGRTGSSITAQRKTLMENISRETAEAAEAENELKGVLSTFHEVVKDLKNQIEAVKNEVKAAAKRTSVASAESPSAV